MMSLCTATGENFKHNSRQIFCSKINVPSVCYKSKACSQSVQQQDLLLLLFIVTVIYCYCYLFEKIQLAAAFMYF